MNVNAYERQELLKDRLNQLAKKYNLEGLLKLTSDLKVDAESLLRIMDGLLQGISPELGRLINSLWLIRFGTVKVPMPKADLRESLIAIQETEIKNLKDEIESLNKRINNYGCIFESLKKMVDNYGCI